MAKKPTGKNIREDLYSGKDPYGGTEEFVTSFSLESFLSPNRYYCHLNLDSKIALN